MAHLSRYELEGVPLAGARCLVYRANDTTTGRAVAIKAMPKLPASANERLSAHLQGLRSIQHPGLSQIEDVYTLDGAVHVVQLWVEGEPLSEWVKRGGGRGWDLALAKSVLRPVLQSLSALHRAHLVHQRLRPDNILVNALPGRPPAVTLLNACYSAYVDELLGQPSPPSPYSPPELVGTHDAPVTPAADVFAAAAVLYRLLVGAPPSPGASSSLSSRLPEVDQTLDEAVMAGLRADPESRPENADAFRALLAGRGPGPMRAAMARTPLEFGAAPPPIAGTGPHEPNPGLPSDEDDDLSEIGMASIQMAAVKLGHQTRGWLWWAGAAASALAAYVAMRPGR